MNLTKFSFLLLLLLWAQQVLCLEYSGQVVAIADGDTFTFLTTDKRQIKVRLAEIDRNGGPTPERAQPYGSRARQALSDLIFGKEVRVVEADTDRYGRLVGHVYVGELHINRQLVRLGMAWVYRQYLQDRTLLQDEQAAREAKRGLWSLPSTEQVPPWEWRRGVKTKAEPMAKAEGNKAQKFS